MDKGRLHDLGLLSCSCSSNGRVWRVARCARLGAIGVGLAGPVGIGAAVNRAADGRRRRRGDLHRSVVLS